jgi:hypothetical protein
MIKVDPIMKLALVVALGVGVTMALGIGQPEQADRMSKLSQTQNQPIITPAPVKAADYLTQNNAPESAL